MSLKDNWQDLQDAVAGDPNSGSDITVKPINDIAHAVIDLEETADVVTNTAPYIGENGNWYIYDVTTKTYIDSGMTSQGEKGEPFTYDDLTEEQKADLTKNVNNEFVVTACLNYVYDEPTDSNVPTIENVSATYAEISEAYQNGQNVVLKMLFDSDVVSEAIVPMIAINELEAIFSLTQSNLPYLAELRIQEDGDIFFGVTHFATRSYVDSEIEDALQDISIEIDDAMSDTSENAVQNKVIKAYVDDITGNLSAVLDELHNYAQSIINGGAV